MKNKIVTLVYLLGFFYVWSYEMDDNFGNRVYSVAISQYGDYIVAEKPNIFK